MASLREIQLELLGKLKSAGYHQLLEKAPGFESQDIRILKGQRIRVSIVQAKPNMILVRSTAFDLPPSSEEEIEIAKILGKDFPAKTESIEWRDGFDIDVSGKIRDLHPDNYED